MSRFLFCSFTLVLLYPTAIDLYLVGLPQIAQALNATESQLHIAFSVYLAGMATTMLMAGKVADSIGRKPVAITGAVIFTGASLLGAIAEQSTSFLVARFIQGIGAGSCYVVAFAILRDTLDDKRRAKVLSILNGITCIVPVIAPVIGYLIMLKFQWTSLFVTMAMMGAVVFLLSVFILKETKPNRRMGIEHLDPNNNLDLNHELEKASFYKGFFISRLITTSLGVTVILTYVNTSPLLIMGDMGFDRSSYSIVMALTALVSMTTSFCAPLALSRFKQQSLLLVSQCLFALAAVIFMLTYVFPFSIYWYLLAFVLVCAGFSIGFGVSMSQALSPFSLHAGVASSLLGIMQVSCSALYIWFMGSIGATALNMLVFILVIASVISLALIVLFPTPEHGYEYEEIASAS